MPSANVRRHGTGSPERVSLKTTLDQVAQLGGGGVFSIGATLATDTVCQTMLPVWTHGNLP